MTFADASEQKQFPEFTASPFQDEHSPEEEPEVRTTRLEDARKLLKTLLEKQDECQSMKLTTPKARTIAKKLHRQLQNKAVTEQGKEHLKLFSPIQEEEQILSRQRLNAYASELARETEIDKEWLEQASTLKEQVEKKHTATAIAIGDEKLYDSWKSDLSSKFYTIYVENENDLSSVSQYEEIRFVPGENNRLTRLAEELEQTIIIRNPSEIQDIAPEFITDLISMQEEAIEALKHLETRIPFSTKIPEITDTENKNISPEELESKASKVAEQVEELINKEVEHAQFSGKNILNILKKNNSILDALDEKIREEIISRKNKLIKEFKEDTGIDITTVITITNQGSVNIDEKELHKYKQFLVTREQASAFERKQELAAQGKIFTESIPSIREELALTDSITALGQFLNENELYRPRLESTPSMSFCQGRNMDLDKAAPVEYHYGRQDNVTVITGANSGGKTTLLELLIQIQILAQSGLYVPARDAIVGITDSMHYFSKNKGSAGAGAFEHLLKQFASISEATEERTLIYADEIESVTEPDIAAQIINTIITTVKEENKSSMVLVTHMGKELAELGTPARFDGIQAKGLDKDFNLIVERNPVIGCIARSTPQLIIERLAKIKENKFYRELHEKIKE
ncbi:MAG: MutS-related protein [Candidatus Woesearchaeota archaeon]